MAIVLGDNRYGKAETRLVHIARDGVRHALTDLNVSIALAGDLAATHHSGDNAQVLPTDSMKNTVYAFARQHGVGEIEDFGARLARHFVRTLHAIAHAEVTIEQFGWRQLGPHSFERTGAEIRTATLGYDGQRLRVVSGLRGLVLLNSTASEFTGYVRDRYTTLPETTDRVLATAVDARWRHPAPDPDGAASYPDRAASYPDGAASYADWAASYDGVRSALVEAFVGTYSYSLQQTLLAMGTRVLQARPEVAEIRLTLPNRHHLPVDLTPFGLDNPGEVFVATDRPYGLIEGTVTRDDVPPDGGRW